MSKRGPYKVYYNFGAKAEVPRSTKYKKRKLMHQQQSDDQSEDFPKEIHLETEITECQNEDVFVPSKNIQSNYPLDEALITSRLKQGKRTSEYEARKSKLEEEVSCTRMTVIEILLMFLNIMKKHSLTWSAILDIFEAINVIFDKNILPVTKYMIKKLMNVKADELQYHIVCSNCNQYLGKYSKVNTIQCECGFIVNSSSMGSCFIELDIAQQLNQFFTNFNVIASLKERFERQKKNLMALEDLYDGEIYKEYCKNYNLLGNEWNLSYTINTDGCQAADSSKVTIWPIYIMIHEIPDYIRKKYMLLIGLWVSKAEPTMNIFLQPFIDQANILSQQGFKWIYDGVEIVSKLFPLGCCVDSVARCAILNMKKFNGINGCTYCEHPTEAVDGIRKYPMSQEVPVKRTDKSIKEQMLLAFQNDKDVMGVWGPSAIMNLKHFDLTRGMILDFMHSCLLGVTELYTTIIMSHANKDYYIGAPAAVQVINNRLLAINPPSCIGKIPRSIQERNMWKASEWLTWLLFYSVPCLNGLLKEKYLHHWLLFVTAMNSLLSNSITPAMLENARILLIKFVFGFEKNFGKNFMYYNVHLLLHLTDTVKNWGPLWAESTFPFENHNKELLKMKKNNYKISTEIALRLLTYQRIPFIEKENNICKRVQKFCYNLNNLRLKKVARVGNSILLGCGKSCVLSGAEMEKLSLCYNINNPTSCKKYCKMIFEKCRYTSLSYSKRKKTNDSVIETKDGKFGIIKAIYLLEIDNKLDVFIFCTLLKTSECLFTTPEVNDFHFKRVTLENKVYCINYLELLRHCIIIKCKNKYFISRIEKGAMAQIIN